MYLLVSNKAYFIVIIIIDLHVFLTSVMDCVFPDGRPNTMKDVENSIKQCLRSNIDRINTYNKRINKSQTYNYG